MSRTIRNVDFFKKIFELSHKFVKHDATLPDYVFSCQFEYVRFFCFDLFFDDSFIKTLTIFCKKLRIESIWYLMLDPDPNNYYYENFKKYGLVEFNSDENVNKVFKAFSEEGIKSSVSALYIIANKFVVFTDDEDWCIWGDRDMECALLGVRKFEKLSSFLNIAEANGIDWITTANGSLKDCLAYVIDYGQLPESFTNDLLKNYNSK